jgi:ubiquinone/menaquinone biosynthesis C-methylase UbiE
MKPRVPEGGAIVDDEDINAEEYSLYMKKKLGGEYRRFIKDVLENMNPPLNARVLEIGPGPGWIGIWLAKERPDLFIDGLEPSPDMIRVANKNAREEGVGERVRYISGYVEKMEQIPDKQYDLIISNESLHHWSIALEGFKEIKRVLKASGKILIRDGRRDLGLGAKFIVNVLGRLFAGTMWKYWKSSLDASYTPQEIRDFLKQIPSLNWVVKEDILGVSIVLI